MATTQLQSQAILMPVGTTAQRPTGVNGMIRYNSDEIQTEVFTGVWTPIVSENKVGIHVFQEETNGDFVVTHYPSNTTATVDLGDQPGSFINFGLASASYNLDTDGYLTMVY